MIQDGGSKDTDMDQTCIQIWITPVSCECVIMRLPAHCIKGVCLLPYFLLVHMECLE